MGQRHGMKCGNPKHKGHPSQTEEPGVLQRLSLLLPGDLYHPHRARRLHFRRHRPPLHSPERHRRQGCRGTGRVKRTHEVEQTTSDECCRSQRHTLMDTLRRAQMEGELDARTDIESLADFFESTLAGIRIAAKAGKTRPALRRIAEVASGTFADVKSSIT